MIFLSNTQYYEAYERQRLAARASVPRLLRPIKAADVAPVHLSSSSAAPPSARARPQPQRAAGWRPWRHPEGGPEGNVDWYDNISTQV